ncbi:LysR substrate-binding domain-containing protein [Pseudomonas sp. PH1b]|uniref:LysR substrate-binding domain-containing protein n=1 Tax=Pseudomonas sp. PH1b TaxID=1397282 RepID=UPI000469FF01|nr:LysR substrate-binding domain-containing protein [Pseudomonas sp. PH1b]BFD42787.1 LysR substrate-binding domain-containing protein [Pseudomonas sp. FFPRI_1]
MNNFTDYRLPSLDALLAFQAGAQLQSFERAADALSLTGSALRKRIAGLEQLLGVSLFERQGGTLMLTVQGQVYLEQISPILAQLLAIPGHQRPVQRKQHLMVSCPPTFARQVLIPRLQEHSLACPDVDLQIQLSAPMGSVDGSACDVLISGDSAEVAPGQRLLDEQLQPMAAPALLARFPDLDPVRDFARLPLLRSPLEPWRPWFMQAGLELLEPRQGPALLDLGMMLEAAAKAQGVVLARPSLAQAWLADGQLVAIGKVRSEPSFHYQLRVRQPSPAAAAFSAWLTRVCHETVLEAEARLQHSL